jgi:hypothetical protein
MQMIEEVRERESDRSSSIEALDGNLTDIRQLASMIAESFAVVAFHKMRRGVEPSGVFPRSWFRTRGRLRITAPIACILLLLPQCAAVFSRHGCPPVI